MTIEEINIKEYKKTLEIITYIKKLNKDIPTDKLLEDTRKQVIKQFQHINKTDKDNFTDFVLARFLITIEEKYGIEIDYQKFFKSAL
jgi:hypothetical protein